VNFLKMRDSFGENGSADRYKCGVLKEMGTLNVRIKLRASAASSEMSLHSVWLA